MISVKSFSEKISRHAKWIVSVGILMAVVGGYYSVLLYKDLRPDLEQLLPKSARSVTDLDEVTQRFQSLDHLAVLVFSKDTEASKKFVDDFSNYLNKNPAGIVDRVEYGIQEELSFFSKRRALYMDLPDLILIKDYIRDKVFYETELRNPLTIFKDEDESLTPPSLDLNQLKKKYNSLISTYDHFPDGYFATQDETKRAVLVYMLGRISEIDRIKKLKKYVDEVVRELNPQSYAPDLQVKYSGELANMLEEQASLTSDLELSGAIVALLVTLSLFFFFRQIRATMALTTCLFFGAAYTFGISFFLVGYLNANSAFLGSIVLGNGINFGIIYLARYMEEKRLGRSHEIAQGIAIKMTSGPTFVAASAAGLSYGSLILTDFRGFSQFGIIGLLGMSICWICTYTLLPAFLSLIDQHRPVQFEVRQHPRKTVLGWLTHGIQKFSGMICLISLGVTLLSVLIVRHISSDLIESDLGKIRSKSVVERGAGSYDAILDEIFQRFLTPVVILPRNQADTKKIEKLLQEKKKQDGPKGMIAEVKSINDVIPKQQKEKIAVLKDIQSLLPEKYINELSPRDRRLVRSLLAPETLKPIRKTDLPPLIKKTFTEKNGAVGKLILVEPPVSKTPHSRPKLLQFVKDLREIVDSVSPGTPVAGAMPVSADILGAIEENGPRATYLALIAVIALVVLLFRRVKTVFLVLVSLFLGVLWMTATILIFDFKINFLNFIAFPITFGIGVDYAVNVLNRYQQEGGENILVVIRNTGGAVTLCSLTTMIGYGSLLLAQSQAFVSFGALAVLGEVDCLISAVIVLPAFLIFWNRRIRKKKVPVPVSEPQRIQKAA
jgi:predicted RND superfamily exporter protein